MADGFIAMLLTLGDGSRFCSQLAADELFECRHPGLLFGFLARQPLRYRRYSGICWTTVR